MPSGLLRTASNRHAAELVRLGWTVEYQFFWSEDEEPYEIGLRWEGDGATPRPSDDPTRWATPEGAHRLASRREVRHQTPFGKVRFPPGVGRPTLVTPAPSA